MILYCYARALDESMTLKSLALASEDDTHRFVATSDDAPESVSGALRAFIPEVTFANGGKRPGIAIEGFGFDEPVPKLVFQKAYGLFPSGMGALVYWLDISPALHDPAPRPEDPAAAVRAIRDDHLSRERQRVAPDADPR